MRKSLKGLVLAGIVVTLSLGLSGTGNAQGISNVPTMGELGDATHGPCETEFLNMPVMGRFCEDPEGRMFIEDMPVLGAIVGPPRPAAAPEAPDRLPVTGVNAGDLLAIGLAALSSGGLLLRRLRMSIGF